MKYQWKQTLHHRIPRNWVELLGTNDERNKVMLPDDLHVNIHRLFWNMEFHNKVLRLVSMDRPVLQRQYAQEIKRLLNEDPSYIYCNWVYVKR